MSRRRTIAAAAALAVAALVLLFRGWPQPAPEIVHEDALMPVAEPRAPTLAVAPRRAAPGPAFASRSGDRVGDSGHEAGGADPDRDSAVPLPWICLEDDPALPKERQRLDVEVVDAHGVPIPGAALQAVWGEWRTKAYTTDGRGRATLDVPRGARALEVVGAPPADARRFLLVHYHPLSGGESSTRIEVRLGSEITGTLLGPDGEPIANAVVHAFPTPFGFGPAKTDARGEFRLNVLDGTEVDVEFDGALDPAASPWPSTLRALAPRIRAGTSGLRVVATEARFDGVLNLRVLLANGEPAAHAEVGFTMSGGTHGHSRTTDDSGRLVLTGQESGPTGADVEIEIAPGPRQRFDRLVADGTEIEVRLAPRTEIKGRVVDGEGHPVPGAWCAALRGHTYLAAFGTDPEGRFATTVPVAPGTSFQLTARFPMDESRATKRGVVGEVVAGRDEPTVVLEDVGPLLAPGRRVNFVRFSVGAVGYAADGHVRIARDPIPPSR